MLLGSGVGWRRLSSASVGGSTVPSRCRCSSALGSAKRNEFEESVIKVRAAALKGLGSFSWPLPCGCYLPIPLDLRDLGEVILEIDDVKKESHHSAQSQMELFSGLKVFLDRASHAEHADHEKNL